MVDSNVAERFYHFALEMAFKQNIASKTLLENKELIIGRLKEEIGEDFYNRVVNKYQLDHLSNQQENLYLSDFRAILVGIVTNVTEEDINNNEKLGHFLEEHRSATHTMGAEHRHQLAASMDERILQRQHSFSRFALRVGKSISDMIKKSNDLKDAFRGIQINAAFEEDIKTVSTINYAHTYKKNEILNNPELVRFVPDPAKRKEIASGLYLASDLAYRNLPQHSLIPVLDKDGVDRIYRVHHLSEKKGLMCTALIPITPPYEIKLMFRGTHDVATMKADLESTGAGSKTMRDNRLSLLDELNALVESMQEQVGKNKVSLSIQGHSYGASLSERFTSELHQAIFHTKAEEDLSDEEIVKALKEAKITWSDTSTKQVIEDFRERLKLNRREMNNNRYEGLANLTHIVTTPANSARLSKKEAHLGEAFIALTQSQSGPRQTINYFKSKGDPVSQAGIQSLGASFAAGSPVKVTALRKNAGYGTYTSMDPALGHCDHPFMRYLDKKNTQPVTFEYDDNTNINRYARLRDTLTSGKMIPKNLQKIYHAIPTPVVEPIKTLKKLTHPPKKPKRR